MEGFAGYYGQTSMHPLVLAVFLLLVVFVLWLPRKFSLVPMLLAATTLPMAQRVIVAGADFTILRMLLLAYMLRLLFRKKEIKFTWQRVDTAMVLWTVASTMIMSINYGDSSALINRVGWSYDILLTYFTARLLIQSIPDLLSHAKAVVLISVPVSLFFIVEWTTRYNIFSIFGGVPELTWIREGRLRCQGPFAHPILAGTFWVSCLPMIWMLWAHENGSRRLCVVGTICTLLIVAACSSSTPIVSSVVAFLGAYLFRYRDHRKLMWIGAIIMVLLLHFVLMDNPVWHLMARADVIGGSTGWHRFRIFDAFVNHFHEWYLLGEANVASWGVWEMRDITNQYVLEGLNGGLLALSAFILALLYCFGNVGETLARCRSVADHGARDVLEWRVWLIGVAMLVHLVTFFAVAYFGQMSTILYIQMGIAGGVVSLSGLQEKPDSVTVPLSSSRA